MRLVSLAFAICLLLVTAAMAWTHGSSASVYDGLVATRGSAPSALRAETQAMSRLASFTRSAVPKIKIITPYWYGNASGEIAPGGTATLTASIEYPAGVCTPLKWSGATSTTIPNGGQVTSDYLTISIPTNTQFWIRQYITGASGVPVAAFQGQNLSLGDALVVGNSGVVDQTASCTTVTDGGTFQSLAPLAIIAPITAPAVCILGDSIALGVDADHTPNSVGDNGEIAPSIGPSFGYSNMAVNGEAASQFVSTHTNRAAVLPYCSHVIVEYGSNDIYLNEDSVATLEGNLTTIYGLVAPGTVTFQSALIARTTSTDGWATTSGQSTITASGEESRRVAFDSALTSGSFGPNGGFFDPQSVVGTGANNGIWKAGASFPACGPWTNDGVHPRTCSYYTPGLLQGGYIDLSRIHR